MYKTMITIVAVATIMTACSSNGAGVENAGDAVGNHQSGQTEATQGNTQGSEQGNTQGNELENNQPTEVDQSQSKNNINHEKWSSLPEYETIIQEIDKGDYNIKTVTDNEGKRILLFDQDGEEQYKTVFIKNTNRLKIINLNGEDEIFNEVINSK